VTFFEMPRQQRHDFRSLLPRQIIKQCSRSGCPEASFKSRGYGTTP
jgi:hypothetical protein